MTERLLLGERPSRGTRRGRSNGWFGLSMALALSAGAAGTTLGCEPQEPDPPGQQCSAGAHNHAEARLLTRSEYRRTVQDLLGTDMDPTVSFPPEPVVEGFENDASSHQANPLLVEKHAQAAQLLAAEVLERGVESVQACSGEAEGETCAEEFIRGFGARAFRRPLTSGEKESFLRLYQRAEPALGHEGALATFIESALQSPQFLYRVEAPISSEQGDVVPLGSYELASRLSYFLWGSMPDEQLFEAARSGALLEREEVEVQARRLLEDDRAGQRVREFHRQWLGLGRLASIARNDSPVGASASWEESTQRFLDHVFWSDEPYVRRLFEDDTVFYDDTLAPLYGWEEEDSWSRISSETRSGLLTQPGILTLFAHSDQTSPIQRGVFIREAILCEEVEPPPPSVDNNPPDPDPSLTTRERFAVHTESPACAQCHKLIDPLGFGLEGYDHLGRFRELENGLPIDTSGELVELTEEALEGPFDGARELSEKIAASDSVLSCLARKWFTFAMGRAHTEGDQCSLDEAIQTSTLLDGDLQELLVALCTSPAFRYRSAHESDGGTNP